MTPQNISRQHDMINSRTLTRPIPWRRNLESSLVDFPIQLSGQKTDSCDTTLSSSEKSTRLRCAILRTGQSCYWWRCQASSVDPSHRSSGLCVQLWGSLRLSESVVYFESSAASSLSLQILATSIGWDVSVLCGVRMHPRSALALLGNACPIPDPYLQTWLVDIGHSDLG